MLIDELYIFLQDEGLLLHWQQHCERDYSLLTRALLGVLSDIRSLRDSALQLLELVRCDAIVPLYHSLSYDAACQYSVTAVMWIFSASLIMSVFGLLMITCRSALAPIHNIYDVNDNNSDHLDHSQHHHHVV